MIQSLLSPVVKKIMTLCTCTILVPDEWATVTVTVPRQDPLHGYNYTIECNVHIIEGMSIPPVILWYHSNGSVVESSHHVIVDSPRSTSSHVKTTLLKFSPVLSDDGGAYTCRAQVTVPWMTDQPAMHSASVNMVVTSMLVIGANRCYKL